MEGALLDREDVSLDKRNDWEEVQNYIKAMEHAIGALEKLPFSSRLMRETHKTLIKGVRGEQKQPGGFAPVRNRSEEPASMKQYLCLWFIARYRS